MSTPPAMDGNATHATVVSHHPPPLEPRVHRTSWSLSVLLLLSVAALPAAETITIKAISGLQYDVKRFALAPGATVTIEFINDDATDMPHNLVFTRPGKRMDVVNLTLAQGPEMIKTGYVPKSDDVIAAIPEVKPHESAKLTFTAPTEKGIYPYVCTYPGHGLIMFGDLYVGVPLPAEKTVVAEPEPANPHPYPLTRPYLYRLFMPDSNPASVAIMLPGDLNLCWDAAACRPRYLWRGAGVDISAYWKGNGSGRVKLVGDKVWTAGSEMPLRFATGKAPVVDFKGYALVQGYPEFRYTIDGVAVKELIKEHEGGKSLITSFVVDSDKPLVYVVDPAQSSWFSSSAGQFKDGTLSIAAKAGRSFTITFTPTPVKPVKKEGK
jgi:azurin